MPIQKMQNAVETVAITTQPVIYGVAGVTILGVTVNDWILIGTGMMLLMNLSLTAVKLWKMWRNKDGDT